MRRRLVWSITALLLCVFLGQTAGATDLVFVNGFTETGVSLRDMDDILDNVIDPFARHWEFHGDNKKGVAKETPNGAPIMLSCRGPGTDSVGYMAFQYLDYKMLQSARSISFGMHVSVGYDGPQPDSLEEDGSLPEGLYKVITTFVVEGKTYTSEVYIYGNAWVLIHTDIPKEIKNKRIETLEIRLEYNPDMPPREVHLTTPALTYYDLAKISAYSANHIKTTSGTMNMVENGISIMPNGEGNAVLEGEAILSSYTETVSQYYLAVTLRDIREEGDLIAAALYEGEENYLESASLRVYQGKNTYLIPLPVVEESKEEQNRGSYSLDTLILEKFRLIFRGVNAYEGSFSTPYCIESIQIYTGTAPYWNASGLGTVTESVLQDDGLIYAGTLTRDAVVAHIHDSIALMAVPMWDRYTLENAIVLDTVRVSNNFRFTIPREQAEYYSKAWLFYAAITTVSGEILPISQPRMLSGAAPESCQLSVLGLHDASVVGVYESNVSHVIVDVPLDLLLLPEGTPGVACSSMDGKVYALSSAGLAALDNEVLFYTNAGMEVCLRLYYAGEENIYRLPVLESSVEYNRYSAIIGFLCNRYPDIASLSLGYGLNLTVDTAMPMEDPVECSTYLAALAALTYHSAAYYNPDIYMVLPIAEDNLNGKTSDFLPAEQLMVLLIESLSSYGNIPYVVSFSFEDDRELEQIQLLPKRLAGILYQNGLPTFGDFLYIWEPQDCLAGEGKPYNLTDRYDALCDGLAESKTRAIILSLTHIYDNVNQEMYTGIKEIGGGDQASHTGRRIYTCTAVEGSGTAVSMGSGNVLALWDFSGAFTTYGFLAGGGIETLETAYSPLISGPGSYRRVLRCSMPVTVFEESIVGNAGGVLLGNLTELVEIKDIGKLVFTFSLEQSGVDPAPATVIFLVGADDWRAEYRMENVEPGKVYYAVCDLAEYSYSGPIDNIGVMLYAQTSLQFDLASIEAVSNVLTTEEMEQLFHPVAAVEPHQTYKMEALFISVILLALTVCLMILLIRRDREEESHG